MQQFVSLKQALEENKLRVGFTKGRAYGSPIDSLLHNYEDKNNIFYRSGDNELLGLLKMLEKGRIDITIGYPWELAYLASQIGKENFFTAIPIKETEKQQNWVISYAGCPKNEWGKAIIKELNQVLLKVRPTDSYMNHLLKWYPKEMWPLIRKAYDELILSVNQ